MIVVVQVSKGEVGSAMSKVMYGFLSDHSSNTCIICTNKEHKHDTLVPGCISKGYYGTQSVTCRHYGWIARAFAAFQRGNHTALPSIWGLYGEEVSRIV